MIKHSFSFCALTLATFLSVSPAALASTALPDIPPEQIALDIERRLDGRTGVVEFHAPTFDPFESVDQLVGRVSLKSNTRTTGIDGHIVRGGAIVDINFLYTTDSDDLYDVAGFESAVFFTGEDVNTTYYDNRIIECSEKIHDVVYQNDYYHGASYGLIGGLYRPYPVYRGHSFFGFRGLNYGWQFPIGFTSRSRFNSSNRFNTRSRFGRSGRFNGDRRVNSNRRGVRSDNNSRRDFDDRSDQRRDDRRDRRSQFDGDGSRGVASRGNRDQVRADRDENTRVERGEKRRVNRSGLRTIKGRAPASSQAGVSEARSSTATRSISASAASETVRSSTRSPSSSAAPTQSRSTSSNNQTVNSSGSQASRPQRSSSSSQPKQSSSSSSSRSRSQPKSSRSQSSRSSRRSSSRSSNRSSRSSRSSSRRKLNFFPQGFLQFGTSGYSARTVSVSQKCARDENLSLHIPRERLEAARYEGLTVFVIDRLGQDVPVYIPPNYIEGFVTTAFGKSQSYQQPQGYQEPTYQEPRIPVPQSPSSQPRIYGDPNGVSPSGSYPQNEGF